VIGFCSPSVTTLPKQFPQDVLCPAVMHHEMCEMGEMEATVCTTSLSENSMITSPEVGTSWN
jgi:hypothetical protein